MMAGHVVNMKGAKDKWQYGEYGLSGRAILSPTLSETLAGFHFVPPGILKIKLQFLPLRLVLANVKFRVFVSGSRVALFDMPNSI